MGNFSWFLMVFITLKLVVFSKNSANFLTLKFLFFIVKLLPSFIMNWWITIFFLVNYKLFCLFSVLSDAILTLLWSFVFQNGYKFFDVINVCCLILPFVFVRFLNIGISHQSNASLFTSLTYLLWRLSFRSYTNFFFEKYLNFLCFSICSSFGRQLCQNCGWAGSEPYVRSHITEPPCSFLKLFSELFFAASAQVLVNVLKLSSTEYLLSNIGLLWC